MRKANRIGNAFRGIVRSQGKLGIRYITKATGDYQEILLPENQRIPKELYEVQPRRYYLVRGFPPRSSRKEVAEQMKEFGVAAVPMKIIENKSGSYNTRMTEDKPTWLIGTEEEIKRKWFFAGPTCYTIKEREEELKAPARRTLEDFIPKTSEEEANSPLPPEAMERAREELQQDAKVIHDEGFKLLRAL